MNTDAQRGYGRMFSRARMRACVLTALLCGPAAMAQSSPAVQLGGTWEGSASAGSDRYPYRWHLSQHGDRISGTVTLSDTDGSSSATYTMRGTLTGTRLHFQGVRLLFRTPGSGWCMASGTLEYRIGADGRPGLSGRWGPHSVPDGCPQDYGGDVELRWIEGSRE